MSGHFFGGHQAMLILLTLGYVLMGLIFLLIRLFHHILPRNRSQDNPLQAIRGDLTILYDYAKQIVVSNPKKAKVVAAIMVCLIILYMQHMNLASQRFSATSRLS